MMAIPRRTLHRREPQAVSPAIVRPLFCGHAWAHRIYARAHAHVCMHTRSAYARILVKPELSSARLNGYLLLLTGEARRREARLIIAIINNFPNHQTANASRFLLTETGRAFPLTRADSSVRPSVRFESILSYRKFNGTSSSRFAAFARFSVSGISVTEAEITISFQLE